MKKIATLLFLLIPYMSQSQDWKEYGVLKNGDTVRIGDSIKILNGSAPHITTMVRPPIEDVLTTQFATDAISLYMNGNTYAIYSMSRWRVSKRPKKYIPIARIKGRYRHMLGSNKDYRIFLDKAIENGVVEVIKRKE